MTFKPDYGPRDFPEDAKDEDNGTYSNMCRECHRRFIGHKRRVICKECHAEHDASARNVENEAKTS